MTAPALKRQVFRVRARLRSPFLFGSVENNAVGVDAQTLTDEDGLPILPADHFKGLLAHALRLLKDKRPAALAGVDATRLFGAPSVAEEDETKRATGGGEAYKPNTGRLLFADLRARTYRVEGRKEEIPITDWRSRTASERALTRIEIDDETETVADGMLQVVELTAPLDAEVDFVGEVVLYADDAEAEKVGVALNKALRLIPYFGAMRSVGFGEPVAEGSVVERPAASEAPLAWPAPMRRFFCEGAFDRPFLLDSERLGDNLFKGATVVPGAAIKGVLAAALRRAGHDPTQSAMRAALAGLRVSHAFPIHPATGALCDRAVPLAVKAGRNGAQICLDVQRDGTEDGLIEGRCADFQSDWKAEVFDKARETLGRPAADIGLRPRGHTAIDPATGAAREGMLFVEAARATRWRKTNEPYRLRFLFEFDKSTALDSPGAAAIFDALRGGLDGVGKTHARLQFEPPRPADPPTLAPISGRRFTIMLETAAALVDLDSPAAPSDAEERPIAAFNQLQRYFAEFLPSANLIDAYLKVRRVGGYPAQRRRAQRAAGHPDDYRPFSLFEPGCCFVFEATPDQALTDKLMGLLRDGLLATRWVLQAGKQTLEPIDDWERFPWLPASGYGEISVADDALRLATGSAQ